MRFIRKRRLRRADPMMRNGTPYRQAAVRHHVFRRGLRHRFHFHYPATRWIGGALVLCLGGIAALCLVVRVPVQEVLPGEVVTVAPPGEPGGRYVAGLWREERDLPVQNGQLVRVLHTGPEPAVRPVSTVRTGVSSTELARAFDVPVPVDDASRWTVVLVPWDGTGEPANPAAAAPQVVVDVGRQTLWNFFAAAVER